LRCPSCGSEIEAELEFCPSCLGGLPRDHVSAASPSPPPTPAAPAPAPEPPASAPATLPDEPCPKHPDFPRAGTCSRCGAFICARCEPSIAITARPLCADCRQRAERSDRAKKVPDLEREIFLLLVGFGIVVGGLFSIPLLLIGLQPRALGFVLIGGPPALGMLALGVLYRLTHRAGIAWAGVIVSLIGTAVFLAIIGLGFNLLTLLFLLMPIVLAYKLSGLAEARKAATALTPTETPKIEN